MLPELNILIDLPYDIASQSIIGEFKNKFPFIYVKKSQMFTNGQVDKIIVEYLQQ